MREIRAQLQAVIVNLDLISHVTPTPLDRQAASTADGKGGRRPPGGVDRRDDHAPDYPLKSADHFRRRVAGCRTDRDLMLVLIDARKALKAWKQAPKVREPVPGDPLFKRRVAESNKTASELARLYGVSARTVKRWRQQYRGSA